MDNYWRLQKFSPLYYYYAYMDTKENLADQVFISHKVPVAFGKEFVKNGSEYKVVFCRIQKKYEKPFLEALSELRDKMLIMGHADYDEVCAEIKRSCG